MGLVPAIILSYSILRNYETRVVNVRESDAQTQLRVLANHLILYNYLANPDSEIVNAELAQFSSFYDGRVLVIDGNLKVVKDTYDMSTGKTAVSEDIVNCLLKGSSAATVKYDRQDSYIEVIMPISETASLEDADYSGDQQVQETVHGVLLASVSTETIGTTLDILWRRAELLNIILGLVCFSLSLLLSELLVRPFEKLTAKISAVKAGYTSDPVEVNDYLETEHIVDAFNEGSRRVETGVCLQRLS